jgi:DNA-binding HxlR family transcriptional regulator
VQALKRIEGRWKVLILLRLLEQSPTNWATLLSALGEVSPKMLTQQLRELESDGLVFREELDPRPPKTVCYHLTALGRALAPALSSLTQWGRLAVEWTQSEVDPPMFDATAADGAEPGVNVGDRPAQPSIE